MLRSWILGATCAMVSVCASSSAWAFEVTSGPTLTLDPNGVTPLAGRVDVSTDVPTRALLHVWDAASSWAVTFPGYRTDHALAVLGIKAGRTYSVELALTDEGGQTRILAPALEVVTAPLPADFPVVQVLASDPPRMEPGFTLTDRFTRSHPIHGPTYSMILDERGEVVWYGAIGGIAMIRLANGNLMYRDYDKVYEGDLLGDVARIIPLDDPGLATHHDLFPTQDGTYLTLTQTIALVEGYPTSVTDPTAPTQTAEVQDNPVVEFAADGSLLHMWRLMDLLDPTRVGYMSLADEGRGLDWAHANAVFHDPRDDSVVVSIRHQDAVVKFSRETGALRWILGNPCNWGPEFQPFLLRPAGTPFAWQYGQHSPKYTPAATLLLYDNGNFRACPFDGTSPVAPSQNASRAVEYAIDEAAMTVRQVWDSLGPPEQRVYSEARSDADWLPITGNVLITHASTAFTGGVSSEAEGLGYRHGRITEVTHSTPPETVFDVRIFDPRLGSPPLNLRHKIELYRSERIPSLYPADVSLARAPGLAVSTPSPYVLPGRTKLFAATATNPGGTAQCLQYWVRVTAPDGGVVPGVARGPATFCSDPFASESRTLALKVPAAAPAGWYAYHLLAGPYPVALAEAVAPFYVVPQ
jgi:arylsulfate sulfotransferase